MIHDSPISWHCWVLVIPSIIWHLWLVRWSVFVFILPQKPQDISRISNVAGSEILCVLSSKIMFQFCDNLLFWNSWHFMMSLGSHVSSEVDCYCPSDWSSVTASLLWLATFFCMWSWYAGGLSCKQGLKIKSKLHFFTRRIIERVIELAQQKYYSNAP